MNRLLPFEVSRLRHARSPRELSAVLSEVEPRLGREVTVADLSEVVAGHHGRTVQRRVATFVRQLPGWASGASLYHLSPGIETTAGRVVEHVAVALRELRGCDGLRQHVSPATASGFVLCQERIGLRVATTCPRVALRSLGYDVVEQVEGAVA